MQVELTAGCEGDSVRRKTITVPGIKPLAALTGARRIRILAAAHLETGSRPSITARTRAPIAEHPNACPNEHTTRPYC
jgi:hypothetical protein